jgi:hypothetical protein
LMLRMLLFLFNLLFPRLKLLSCLEVYVLTSVYLTLYLEKSNLLQLQIDVFRLTFLV